MCTPVSDRQLSHIIYELMALDHINNVIINVQLDLLHLYTNMCHVATQSIAMYKYCAMNKA